MLYIDDIGKDAISEIKAGKADFSAKLLGDNSLGASFSFGDLSKQQGTVHLCFPVSDPNAPVLVLDASNADKEKGKIFQFSINNIRTGFLKYSVAADFANGIFSVNFPCYFACDLRKDLPLQFNGNLKINFHAKRIPKNPSKLVAAARDLEERARRFQEQNNLNAQPQNNDNDNNPDEVDLNDDRNLNLSLDFIQNEYTYTYYNTFAANGCFAFDFLDIASIKFKLGAAVNAVDSAVEPIQGTQQNPEANGQLFEEEEELQGDNEENNQREEPQTLPEAADNDASHKENTSLCFYSSIEGCIAQNLNFVIASDEEKSTNEISFHIPKTDFSFGLCTSIYNGKTGLNSIGTSLVYNAKDGLSRVGFAYDAELGKDNASDSWYLGGGIFRTQLSRIVFADFNEGAPLNNNATNLKSDKKDTTEDSDRPFLARNMERFRLFLCSLRDNLKDTKVFTFASSLAFDFSNNYNYSKFIEGSFGVSCDIPQSIAPDAQFQVLTSIKQIEDEVPQSSSMFDYSLSTRYSWLATEKTNLSLYAKISTSKLLPTLGFKLAYKD